MMAPATTALEHARAHRRRLRALDLLCLAPGFYATPARRVMFVDVPELLASMPTTPSRARLVARYTVDALRAIGLAWPIVLRYGGVGGRQ